MRYLALAFLVVFASCSVEALKKRQGQETHAGNLFNFACRTELCSILRLLSHSHVSLCDLLSTEPV